MPAFPTAGGFGANSLGGRGGVVYEVTSLADTNTPGTLRYAVNQVGARTVVFRIDGTIVLTSSLTISNPYITIVGQTAPGQGIQLKNYGFIIAAHDVIIRFMRFRPGVDAVSRASNGTDNVACWTSGLTAGGLNSNVIVDHCEMWWSTDQQMDAYGNVTDVTYQYCLCAESSDRLNPQTIPPAGGIALSYGSISGFEPYGGTTMRVTHHHNLYAHNRARNPAMISYLAGATVGSLTWQFEMRNNVIYNWQADGGSSQLICAVYSAGEYNNWASALGWPNGAASTVAAGQANIIGNYWKRGPTNNSSDPHVLVTCDFIKMHVADSIGPTNNYAAPINGYSVGVTHVNVPDSGQNAFAYWPNWDATSFSRSTPFAFPSGSYPAVVTQASTALMASLLPVVGCAQVVRNSVTTAIRDAASTRVINDVINGTGVCGGAIHSFSDWTSGVNNVYPTLTTGTAPTDSDHDGIPDAWATAHGLNPNGNPGPVMTGNGYTNLENYLNELAGDVVAPVDTPPAPPTGVTVT